MTGRRGRSLGGWRCRGGRPEWRTGRRAKRPLRLLLAQLLRGVELHALLLRFLLGYGFTDSLIMKDLRWPLYRLLQNVRQEELRIGRKPGLAKVHEGLEIYGVLHFRQNCITSLRTRLAQRVEALLAIRSWHLSLARIRRQGDGYPWMTGESGTSCHKSTSPSMRWPHQWTARPPPCPQPRTRTKWRQSCWECHTSAIPPAPSRDDSRNGP